MCHMTKHIEGVSVKFIQVSICNNLPYYKAIIHSCLKYTLLLLLIRNVPLWAQNLNPGVT